MDLNEVMSGARQALTVERVFGQPIERNGVTVIPVAHVAGAGGGGGGGDTSGNSGAGGGFGGYAWPAGVYVIRGDEVRWQPALDPTAMALRGLKILMVLLKALGAGRKRRAKRKR